MTSEKKIRANRLNAERSTGPKTSSGKAAAAQNAWKHGLRAQRIFPLRHENNLYLNHRFNQLHGCLAPVGYLEDFLVERIFNYQRELECADLVQYTFLCAESPKLETLNNIISTIEKRMEWWLKRPKELTELEQIEALERRETMARLEKLVKDNADEPLKQERPSARWRPTVDQGMIWADGQQQRQIEEMYRNDQWSIEDLRRRHKVEMAELMEVLQIRVRIAKRSLTEGEEPEVGIDDNNSEEVSEPIKVARIPERYECRDAAATTKMFEKNSSMIKALTEYRTSAQNGWYKALHELERLQGRRKGQSVIPALAVDINADSQK
jgi:hypothetical protein